MAYWLLKSEPNTYSWNDLVKLGSDHWDGVRNYQARNNMIQMKVGDQCFFYHSVKEKRIVGICEVIKEHYPDHTDPTGKFVCVTVKPVAPVKSPVTLQQMKETPGLENMSLLKQSRLSVCPVTASEWQIIQGLS